jgi:hypothetical protein
MKTKKVNRYYCDFCKKSGGSAGHIRRHEKHCTNNINRECGVCKNALDKGQRDLNKLIQILPNVKNYLVEDYAHPDALKEDINKAIPTLRKESGKCPACMLAALRLSKIPLYLCEFDFKKEMSQMWSEINDSNAGAEIYGY